MWKGTRGSLYRPTNFTVAFLRRERIRERDEAVKQKGRREQDGGGAGKGWHRWGAENDRGNENGNKSDAGRYAVWRRFRLAHRTQCTLPC